MTREIRFRAWEEHKKEMIYEGFELKSDGTMLADGGTEVSAPLMQYTGLKDRNGKEIYEGDIVSMGEVKNREVYWYHVHGAWYMRAKPHTQELAIMAEFVKVIGNIYENPELLK